jgi:hypothetical protein
VRKLALFGIWAALMGAAAVAYVSQDRGAGCPLYPKMRGKILIAHAGGGLPDGFYANSTEAMDLAYAHGHRLIELDFQRIGGAIYLGHRLPNLTTAADVLDWLRAHPGASIVTDFKTDNVSGLRELARQAGPLRNRFIPQFYFPSEYGPVTALGMQKPIFTMYRLDSPATDFANAADVQFVTLPVGRRAWAKGIRKPVLLHTVNFAPPWPVAGYYTDCLVPA